MRGFGGWSARGRKMWSGGNGNANECRWAGVCGLPVWWAGRVVVACIEMHAFVGLGWMGLGLDLAGLGGLGVW